MTHSLRCSEGKLNPNDSESITSQNYKMVFRVEITNLIKSLGKNVNDFRAVLITKWHKCNEEVNRVARTLLGSLLTTSVSRLKLN